MRKTTSVPAPNISHLLVNLIRRVEKSTLIQVSAHVGALIPLALMAWDLYTANYGPDPIREFTLRTGKSALVLLILSLACKPAYSLFKFRQALKLRRPLGLYAYMYVLIHMSIFIGVDYFFDLALIKEALLEKRYALAGLATAILLTPLAITSTRGWMRRLGKKWKLLHKLVYLAGGLAVVHFIWLVKPGVSEPWLYAGLLIVMLLLRVQPVKSWGRSFFNRIRGLLRR